MAERRLACGALIAFEGIDGSGKTTQARRLAHYLRNAGVTVVLTKEPTNGPHGARLRASASSGRLDPEAEVALFEVDRRDHVAQVIAPALARGEVVIVDRYYFSTAAYQGARGLDPEAILMRNEAFAPAPDLLVLLEIPVAVGLARIRERGDGAGNLFEREDTLAVCDAIFRRLDRPYVLRLDATAAPDEVHGRVIERVGALDGMRPRTRPGRT